MMKTMVPFATGARCVRVSEAACFFYGALCGVMTSLVKSTEVQGRKRALIDRAVACAGCSLRSKRARKALALCAWLAVIVTGCERGTRGPCSRVVGTWQGANIEPEPGRDPEAARVLRELLRDETWRITRVTSSGLQRERTDLAGGRPIAEPMFVREEAQGHCVVEVRGVRGARSIVTLTPRADGTLAARTEGNWYTAIYRRR